MTKTQHKYTEKKLRLKKGPMFSALYNGIKKIKYLLLIIWFLD